MYKFIVRNSVPFAAATALFALVLSTGCAGVSPAGRQADTELRGVLILTASNAPADVVAVLESRNGTRTPCNLWTTDRVVITDIQFYAAKGTVVRVAGDPGNEAFHVTDVWPDGQRRHKGHAVDLDKEEKKGSFWPDFTWASVPGRDK